MPLRLVGFLLLAILLSIPLHAGEISVNFTGSELYGSPGDVLTFGGTLVNNTGFDVYINGVGLTLEAFDPSAYDLTDFLVNAPLTMANGDTVGPFDFFTVTIPSPFTDGTYIGTLVVQGGADPNDDAPLGIGSPFTVDVGAPASSVPEPATLLLMGGLLAGLGAIHRRRR